MQKNREESIQERETEIADLKSLRTLDLEERGAIQKTLEAANLAVESLQL